MQTPVAPLSMRSTWRIRGPASRCSVRVMFAVTGSASVPTGSCAVILAAFRVARTGAWSPAMERGSPAPTAVPCTPERHGYLASSQLPEQSPVPLSWPTRAAVTDCGSWGLRFGWRRVVCVERFRGFRWPSLVGQRHDLHDAKAARSQDLQAFSGPYGCGRLERSSLALDVPCGASTARERPGLEKACGP